MDGNADVNYSTRNGTTAVLLAVNKNYARVLEVLLKRRAAAEPPHDSAGPYIQTPLHLAIKNKSHECVDLLCKYGSPLSTCNTLQHTPLMTAIHDKHFKCARVLLRHANARVAKRRSLEKEG